MARCAFDPVISKQEAIWQIVSQIPAGRVASYGQVARLAGLPGHARWVGRVLSDLPADSGLPWHRVVNSQGLISLGMDSEAGRLQASRLAAEGVEVRQGKIRMARFGWMPQ